VGRPALSLTAERLLAKSEPEPMSGCWLWTGARANGYGALRVNMAMMKAHRGAWVVWRGAIPEDRCVLHRCDTPACINPDHLFLGTHDDNAKDRNRKGRQSPHCPPPMPGKQNPNALLTDADVRAIRAAPMRGRRQAEALGNLYGISWSNVYRVRQGYAWIHAS